MFHNLKKALRFSKFDSDIRAIVDTPPIGNDDDAGVVCVSHIGKMYLLAYLLAIKSLARCIPLKKVVIVDDLTLTDEDKALLKDHIRGVDIRPIIAVTNEKCPTGGDWEGFLLIGDESRDSYCILLDADTVATGPLTEVIAAIASNRSFTLGTWKDQQIESAAEASEHVKGAQSKHVQIVAEQALYTLDGRTDWKYVRGCGGFAGFAKGTNIRSDIEQFSGRMEALLGSAKWKEWGSQQVASNFVVANRAGSMVLPFPKYASFAPGLDVDATSFVHFIGSHRFEQGAYSKIGKRVIQQLRVENNPRVVADRLRPVRNL